MDIHLKDLASVSGFCKDCVRQYMSRADFSHIPLRRGVYCGIEIEDIKKLKEINEKRRWGKRKKCYSNIAENANI